MTYTAQYAPEAHPSIRRLIRLRDDYDRAMYWHRIYRKQANTETAAKMLTVAASYRVAIAGEKEWARVCGLPADLIDAMNAKHPAQARAA